MEGKESKSYFESVMDQSSNFTMILSDQEVEDVYKDIIIKNISQPMTLNNIQIALKDIKISFPDGVLKKIIIESGHLKSKLTTKGNNLFGMRKPGVRPTAALETKLYGYATYKHWIYSIIDYKLWELYNPPKENDTYKSYLTRRKWNT